MKYRMKYTVDCAGHDNVRPRRRSDSRDASVETFAREHSATVKALEIFQPDVH